MSIGYIPKKRAKVRRLRRLRKKYKNFSCDTCAKRHFDYPLGPCKKRYQASCVGGLWVGYYENCDQWKADKDYVEPKKLGVIVLKTKKHWLNKTTLKLGWFCFCRIMTNDFPWLIWKYDVSFN